VSLSQCFKDFPYIRYLGKGCGKSARYLFIKSKGHQQVRIAGPEEECSSLKERDFDPSAF